ncbi:hypothetical protein [Nitrosopumilus ureiphilus]|nr:hypothetical protein [Nitrosopumilus ureiphilus]
MIQASPKQIRIKHGALHLMNNKIRMNKMNCKHAVKRNEMI